MKKMWEVVLRRSYDFNDPSSKKYCVIANNAKEAIDKSINAHKRRAKKTYDYLDFRCVVNVELIATTD